MLNKILVGKELNKELMFKKMEWMKELRECVWKGCDLKIAGEHGRQLGREPVRESERERHQRRF